jgi:hypothetical protein
VLTVVSAIKVLIEPVVDETSAAVFSVEPPPQAASRTAAQADDSVATAKRCVDKFDKIVPLAEMEFVHAACWHAFPESISRRKWFRKFARKGSFFEGTCIMSMRQGMVNGESHARLQSER